MSGIDRRDDGLRRALAGERPLHPSVRLVVEVEPPDPPAVGRVGPPMSPIAGRSIEELRALLGAEADGLTDAEISALAESVAAFARLLVSGYMAACRAVRDEAVTPTRRA